MKQCPQCRQTYSDETIFCLSDGTPLAFLNDKPEEVTIVQSFPEEITFVRPVQNTQPTIVTPVQPIQPIRSGVSPIFAYLSIILLLLLIGGGAIVVGFFVLSRMSSENTNANTEVAKVTNKPLIDSGQNKINDQKANLQQQQDQLQKEKERLANERKKLDEEKNKPLSTPTISTPPPVPTPPASYPPQPTARIKFGRGRVSGSVSGKVYTQRSFVLEAMSGQYLSATVNGGGCVTFSNGGSSTGFTTVRGDNRLTLVNNCQTEGSFSLTVTIR
jgi:hypothetical protein